MAELVILGSGGGLATQDRFSTSIALLAERNLYLLDCGEPCAALLFRHGIDPLALRALFISHMHPDHVSGLAALLSSLCLLGRSSERKFRPWSIHRNAPWYRNALRFPSPDELGGHIPETRPHVTIVLPSEALEPVKTYLPAVYLAPAILPFDLDLQAVEEGLTYDDGLVCVTAVPNTHLSANSHYQGLLEAYPHMALESYSYRAEVEGHKLIFSGDITKLDEVNPLLDGADTLIVEVAHYDPADIGSFVRNLSVKQVVLTHIHPGLEDRMPPLVEEWADPRIQIAYDGMRIPLE